MYLLFFSTSNTCGFDLYTLNSHIDCNSNIRQLLYDFVLQKELGNLELRIFSMCPNQPRYYNNIETFEDFSNAYNSGELDEEWYNIGINIANLNLDKMYSEVLSEVLAEIKSHGTISIGQFVRWKDPEIKEFSPEDQETHLNRIYKVIMIDDYEYKATILANDNGHTILISDDFGETEALAHELIVVE